MTLRSYLWVTVLPIFCVSIFASAQSGAPSDDRLWAGLLPGYNTETTSESSSLAVRRSLFVQPAAQKPKKNPTKFHWGRALAESGAFLAMQHTYLAWRDDRWITAENGIPFNHYLRDYKKSLNTWAHSGWDDGDPFLDNYIGHPIQGALTGYFQVQNDPKGAALEFSNTRPYWTSRLKAMAWNAAFSTQWELGPVGEMTVEKYGTWGAWKQNGKWVNGEGQVDLVVTPLAGFGWMVGEDLLDRYFVRRVEASTGNRFLIDLTRCALNPIRGGANILHGRKPWHRESRDRKAETH